ncbi:hypothetical protein [Streptomyces griseoruber]|uniref:Uncharacterized protein n=1 Tax=Streptomyces griseoruber TaxID=1943 RepID=A0A117RBK1_9ACTN|nr:hypothetical protein [Streptomyces griseoruber]KUN81749.1 hypothetical protein AQJ64_21375 [Streptomyces griseoruber]
MPTAVTGELSAELRGWCGSDVFSPRLFGFRRDPEESAFWLDDDLPHVRRWAEAEAEAEGK